MRREIPARRLRDVPASAVIRGDGEREPRVACRERFAGGDEIAYAPVEARRVADDLEADAVGMQLRDLLLERTREEIHQDRDFIGGPAPVLAREREERQVFDALLDCRTHRGAHRFDALAMSGDAREQPLVRPAAVAVHDDGDMSRDDSRLGNDAR